MRYKIAIGDSKFDIEVGEIEAGLAEVAVNGTIYQVNIENYAEVAPARGVKPPKTMTAAPRTAGSSAPRPAIPAAAAVSPIAGEGMVVAPIPGLILQIKVKVGDAVSAGQVVAVLEAMKMENNISSNISGTVTAIRVGEGSQVTTGDVIMVIE
jgi:biotin carboxyl carrier protein